MIRMNRINSDIKYINNDETIKYLEEYRALTLELKEKYLNNEEVYANLISINEPTFNINDDAIYDTLMKMDDVIEKSESQVIGDEFVEVGDIVTYEYSNDGGEKLQDTCLLIDCDPSLNDELREVSIYSPLGKAIYGASIGEGGIYSINNVESKVTVLDISKAYDFSEQTVRNR